MDSSSDLLRHLSYDGKLINTFNNQSLTTGSDLYNDYNIVIGSNSSFWVVDSANSRIMHVSADGKLIETIALEQGSEPGQFGSLEGLGVDSTGNLWITDATNNRLQKFVRQSGRENAVYDSVGQVLTINDVQVSDQHYAVQLALQNDNFWHIKTVKALTNSSSSQPAHYDESQLSLMIPRVAGLDSFYSALLINVGILKFRLDKLEEIR